MALEAAKRARDRGVDVHWAREELKASRVAFMRGDFPGAMAAADSILARLGEGSGGPPGAAAHPPPAPPESADRGVAAGRIAQAKEVVRTARTHGFNVRVAKSALQEAKRAFRTGQYTRAVQFADQAIALSGSTGRAGP